MEAQLKIRQNAIEAQDYMRDLLKWEEEQRRKDKLLSASKRNEGTECAITSPSDGISNSLKRQQPARASNTLETSNCSIGKGGTKPAASHTYDNYRNKWDKFDYESALGSDEDQNLPINKPTSSAPTQSDHPLLRPLISQRTVSSATRSKTANAATTSKVPDTKPSLRDRDLKPDTAEEFRNVGNEYFKKGQYLKAKESYSSSVACSATCLGYANRAMACLKLGEYSQAEGDCTEAIKLDPLYVKAFHRRATARKLLKKYTLAAQDLEAALRLEPSNKLLQKEFIALLELAQTEYGVSEPPARVRIPVTQKLRQQDEETVKKPEEARSVALPPVATESSRAKSPSSTNITRGLREEPKTKSKAKIPVETSSKSVSTKAAHPVPTTAHLPSRKLRTPKTGAEFETTWRSLKDDAASQAQYLMLVKPQVLPQLFKLSITAPLLVSLCHVILREIAPQDPACALDLLSCLAKIPRIDMVAMLIPRVDRAAVEASVAAVRGGLTEHDQSRLDAIMRPYL